MGEFSSISLDYSFQSWNKTKCFLLPVLLIITELSRHWKWRHFRYRIFFFFLFISIVRCPLIPPKEVALFRTQRRCGHTTLNEASLLPHLSKKSKTPKTAESRDKLLMMSSNNICLAWFTDISRAQATSPLENEPPGWAGQRDRVPNLLFLIGGGGGVRESWGVRIKHKPEEFNFLILWLSCFVELETLECARIPVCSNLFPP